MDIIVIDDEVKMGRIISRTLSREGYEVEATADPNEGLEWLRENPVRLILCDLKMPEMSGIEVLEKARRIRPDLGFIIMTAYASAESAVEAMKKGAFDYIIKPFATEELKTLVARCLETQRLRDENEALKQRLDEKFNVENIVAKSEAMREALAAVRKVSRGDATVLLRGESGTGKEVLAGAIHQNGPRRDRPMIKVNCGALPDNLLESELFGHVKGAFTGASESRRGLFETADGGTVFLDEIGDITPPLQIRLLRVLQEGEFQRVGDTKTLQVDVRVIAATHRNLEEAMKAGEFRQDLYYRLNVVPIFISPLRERAEDIPPLIERFLQRYAPPGRKIDMDGAALDAMLGYLWPGNVRELENAVEHAAVMLEGDTVTLEDLPLAIRRFEKEGPAAEADFKVGEMTLEEMERRCLVEAMRQTGNNHTQAAKLLGVTRRTLGYRLRKYGLKD